MSKIVYKRTKAGRRLAKSAVRSMSKKRIANTAGRWTTVVTLDANSSNFDDTLGYVFSKNVAKARRENKRLLGTADVAPRKR